MERPPTQNSKPEKTVELTNRFTNILKSVNVPGWSLEKVTTNYGFGISVYGYFVKESSDPLVRVKVRISDHAGRWSL